MRLALGSCQVHCMRVAPKRVKHQPPPEPLNGQAKFSGVLGQVIARHRTRLNMSQVELAAKMKVTQSVVSRIEQGQPATVDQLCLFAKHLDLKSYRLLQEADEAATALKSHGIKITLTRQNNAAVGEAIGGVALGALLGVLLTSKK